MHDAKTAAPGYDVYALYDEWVSWWHDMGKPELKSPRAAFPGFCKKRHERKPLRRSLMWTSVHVHMPTDQLIRLYTLLVDRSEDRSYGKDCASHCNSWLSHNPSTKQLTTHQQHHTPLL